MSMRLYGRQLGQLDEAINWARKSNKVDPGKILGLVIEYNMWLSLGDDARAQAIYKKMEDLDASNSWLPSAKSWMDTKNGRYAAAIEEARYLEQGFKMPAVQWAAAVMYARAGDFSNAREVFLKIEPRYADREQWPVILNEGQDDACIVGLTLARTGDEVLGSDLLRYAASYWEETLPRYIEHADRLPSYECHAYLGEVDQSLAALKTSLDHKHALRYWLWIAIDPELRLIQEDPRFKAMDKSARAELARQHENAIKMELEAGP